MDKPKNHMNDVCQKKQIAGFSELRFGTQKTIISSPFSTGASGISNAI